MTAEEAVVAWLNITPNVTAFVGNRIYPMLIPQGVAMPAIAYQRISTLRPGSLRGPVDVADPRLQLNCWADNYGTAKDLADEVRRALDGSDLGRGREVATVIVGELDLLNPDSQRKCVTQDYSIWIDET